MNQSSMASSCWQKSGTTFRLKDRGGIEKFERPKEELEIHLNKKTLNQQSSRRVG
jgi:hypothetical protein